MVVSDRSSKKHGARKRGGYARKELVDNRKSPQFEALLDAVSERWSVPRDDLDVRDIVSGWAKTWVQLSPERQFETLIAAETIARAEREKAAWNPKFAKDRYTGLAKKAIAAAELAEQLADLFPPPWEHSLAPIGNLINQLGQFVIDACKATVLEKDILAGVAGKRIRAARPRSNVSAKVPEWEMFGDLAWLASNRRHRADLRTLRRYRDELQKTKVPGAELFKNNWPLVQRIARMIPGQRDNAFKRAIEVHIAGSPMVTIGEVLAELDPGGHSSS